MSDRSSRHPCLGGGAARHWMVAILLVACAPSDRTPAAPPAETPPVATPPDDLKGFIEHQAVHAEATAAYRWADIMLEVTAREVEKVGARPTIISRQMAIPMTAMYDAWAAYDAVAVGTRLGGSLRRPPEERTLANKEIAIAWAVYLTLVDLFPADRAFIDEQMRKMGHDPTQNLTETSTPQGIGRAAAMAVLQYRKNDGSNQHGDAPGCDGTPYSDTTGYVPVNTLQKVVDPDRWQPIPFDDGKGGTFAPGFLTPQWGKVKPFALERGDQFRPPPPPKYGSAQLKAEIDECIAFNAGLTLEQKATVEFMRDGPRSTGQSGHWLRFAQDLSRRDRYDLDRDVKLFFAVANTAFDAFIASWDAKRHYDSSRPWTLVRQAYQQAEIDGYLGACKGVGKIPATSWMPYSPPTFLTPPFPGYPSGHSSVSGACAKLLELLSGSDRFGAYYRLPAGIYTEPECPSSQMQARNGTPAADAPASTEVILRMPTFSATAELAGISRVMGGYHIQADNVEGLTLGRRVAEHGFTVYQAYFDGTAKVK